MEIIKNKILLLTFSLLFSLIFIEQAEASKSYRYCHHETTGLTESIQDQGQEITVQFHPQSDPKAIKLLRALNIDIAYLEQNKILLQGE